MKILGLDHIQLAIPTGGEEEARNFYVQLLGLTELAKPAELAGRGGAWFQCGELQLHLGIDKEFRPAKKAHPALRVQQLAVLLTRLREAGCEVTDDHSLQGVKRAFTQDPFGNRVELVASENAV